MTELGEYKKEIPQLKERCYDVKTHLNNVKTGMLGSNGLAIRESLIQDISSLKDQIARLESELKELTEHD